MKGWERTCNTNRPLMYRYFNKQATELFFFESALWTWLTCMLKNVFMIIMHVVNTKN